MKAKSPEEEQQMKKTQVENRHLMKNLNQIGDEDEFLVDFSK
jgi:hypothetical protein